METTTRKLLTPDEAAALFGITKRAIYMRIQRGEIPYIKIGSKQVRFDPDQIEKYIQEHTIPPFKKAAAHD